MKMQKSVIFVGKTLKVNMLKIKKNNVTDHCLSTDPGHSVCNLKCSILQEITTIFIMYQIMIIIEELIEEVKRQFTYFGEIVKNT